MTDGLMGSQSVIIFASETATNLSISAYLFVKPKLFSYIYIFEY